MFSMLEIKVTLLVLLLFPVIGSVCSGWVDPTRTFLEPFDQNTFKKSCGNAMLAGQDYFVVKGLVNISGLEYGPKGAIAIWIQKYRSYMYLLEYTVIYLYNEACKDLAQIPIDTCKCTFMDNKFVRVKCNITAKLEQSRGDVILHYAFRRWYNSRSLPLPVVYGNPSCTERSANRAAKIHPESFTALIGASLFGMAVVCLGSSIFS
ncbi:unnamed protein product [Lymnaea stagnalis]|uniref:Uncharacterized protein n=1 Tax=Lymnaea stagnalis TaxID=6523 RepID=A0AAV2INL3_LYMST